MPRMTAGKRTELETFWRSHLDGWRLSDLNQREYCELHGLPLKRFGNWRAKLGHEEPAATGKLLYRRGGGLKHMSEHMLKEIPSAPSSYIPSARSGRSSLRLPTITDVTCQWRSKKGPPRRCKKGPLLGMLACLAINLHGRAPRAYAAMPSTG